MPRGPKKARPVYYNAKQIVDDPDQHGYSRAFGLLTSDPRDAGPRPASQRIREFLSAFPPGDPVRFIHGGSLVPSADGHFEPGTQESRLARFLATDGRSGSLPELLARYGLKLAGAPAVLRPIFEPAPFRETAQRRNVKLRVLHGSVDIEPSNMDAAKAEFLDRQEKKQAAADVRLALRRMKEELDQAVKK